VQLCDGHPFNANFLAEAIKEYTLSVVLGDPSEITQWKRRRANQFLQDLQFSDEEAAILATLKDFSVLDFDLLSQVVGGKIEEVSKAISRLMDYHMVETIGDTFLIAPPMRDAVERDLRFSLAPDRHRRMLSTISNQLIAANDDASVSLSLVEAGVLATLQEGKELSPLFSSFLLPSHLDRQERSSAAETCPKPFRNGPESPDKGRPPGRGIGWPSAACPRMPVTGGGGTASLLRHPGLAQADEIGGFVKGADLRDPQVLHLLRADAAQITTCPA
jgi:hypothetical protein